MSVFAFIVFYLIPILSIVFCLNLVGILKKINKDQATSKNTFWMTVSFALIVWTISVLALAGA